MKVKPVLIHPFVEDGTQKMLCKIIIIKIAA
jgi:hypothetical protein